MSALDGAVPIPVLGSVPKKAIIPVAAAAIGYVGYRWYQSRSAAAADTSTTDGTDPGFDDAGTLPGVDGAGTYGFNPVATDTTDTTDTITTNAEWTAAALSQLSASDTWSYTDIVTALGNYLTGRPLSTLQQSIVRAAIAVAGNPPVGSFSLIGGGDTDLTVAPTGLRVASTSTTTVTVTFTPPPGATHFVGYHSGAAVHTASSEGPSITFAGLTPNTTYSFTVAGESASGKRGPLSAPVSAKTGSVKLAIPRTPSVSAVGQTSAHFTTGAVGGATGYNWYVNGVAHGHSDGPSYTASGLKANTTYRVSVAADTATQSAGKASGTRSFKTKR